MVADDAGNRPACWQRFDDRVLSDGGAHFGGFAIPQAIAQRTSKGEVGGVTIGDGLLFDDDGVAIPAKAVP